MLMLMLMLMHRRDESARRPCNGNHNAGRTKSRFIEAEHHCLLNETRSQGKILQLRSIGLCEYVDIDNNSTENDFNNVMADR